MEQIPKRDGKTIPIEIIHDILLYLPIKTLKRFLSVSKPWHSLISDPAFQRAHYRQGSQRDPLLLLTSCDEHSLIPSTLHLSTCTSIDGTLVDKWSTPVEQVVVPIQSCQGLICFTELDIVGTQILIYNPATREIFTVPPSDGDSICVGFGYVDSAKEFKVVRFVEHDGPCSCEMFTLGSSDWREARQPPANFPLSSDQNSWVGVAPFVNGYMYLMLPPITGNCADWAIQAFHIESEEYNSISLPEYCCKVAEDDSSCIMTVQESRGSLYLIISFETSIWLWLLEDNENGNWVEMYNIDLTPIGYRVLQSSVAFDQEALVILGDGTILLNVNSESEGDYRDFLYSYNPRDKSFMQKSDGCRALLYVESFFPVGSIR